MCVVRKGEGAPTEFGKPRFSPARACEFLGPSPPTLAHWRWVGRIQSENSADIKPMPEQKSIFLIRNVFPNFF